MNAMILNDIYSMVLGKKRERLFKRHARNSRRTLLEKSEFESVEILNSVFEYGSVKDIKLMCGMSNIDVVNKYMDYCLNLKPPILYHTDYLQILKEREEIKKVQNKMNLFLETRCPTSKKQKFRKTKNHRNPV